MKSTKRMKKSKKSVPEQVTVRTSEKLKDTPSFKQVMENIRKERKKHGKHESKNRTSR